MRVLLLLRVKEKLRPELVATVAEETLQLDGNISGLRYNIAEWGWRGTISRHIDLCRNPFLPQSTHSPIREAVEHSLKEELSMAKVLSMKCSSGGGSMRSMHSTNSKICDH